MSAACVDCFVETLKIKFIRFNLPLCEYPDILIESSYDSCYAFACAR